MRSNSLGVMRLPSLCIMHRNGSRINGRRGPLSSISSLEVGIGGGGLLERFFQIIFHIEESLHRADPKYPDGERRSYNTSWRGISAEISPRVCRPEEEAGYRAREGVYQHGRYPIRGRVQTLILAEWTAFQPQP